MNLNRFLKLKIFFEKFIQNHGVILFYDKNIIENSKILYIVKKFKKKSYTLYKNKFLKKFTEIKNRNRNNNFKKLKKKIKF